tara:strand:- start:26 stop:925 length:900 start_codon:yes stop_codon:yes gene_type:complete
VATWSHTKHSTAFNKLHRMPEAKEIARKMGIRRIKGDPLCQTCHFTVQLEEGKRRAKAIAGTSCESCHGPAKQWRHLHNDYGGQGATRETETPEHRRARLEKTAELGMIRPDHRYEMVSNCFQCHTVPNEELVNTGGHTAGSEFELVAWSQGEVRHNFFISNGRENRAAPRELDPKKYLRFKYVLGRLMDLEYGLRAAAKATQPGAYIDAVKKRVEKSRGRLEQILAQSGDQQLKELIDSVLLSLNGVEIKPDNPALLLEAADGAQRVARGFAADFAGSALDGVNALLPPESAYKRSDD